MNRAEHYEEAERLLEQAKDEVYNQATVTLLAAQVHATLATYNGVAYTAEAYAKFADTVSTPRWGASGGDR